jgi:hypothetical protein
MAQVHALRISAALHGSTWMLVQMTTDTVDVVETPLYLLTQGYELFLDSLVDRSYVELRVLQEIQ